MGAGLCDSWPGLDLVEELFQVHCALGANFEDVRPCPCDRMTFKHASLIIGLVQHLRVVGGGVDLYGDKCDDC